MRSVMIICTAAALATTLLSSPAFAQQERPKTGPALEEELKAKRNVEIDKEYRAARKYTRDADKPVQVDPWQNMRAPTDSAAR